MRRVWGRGNCVVADTRGFRLQVFGRSEASRLGGGLVEPAGDLDGHRLAAGQPQQDALAKVATGQIVQRRGLTCVVAEQSEQGGRDARVDLAGGLDRLARGGRSPRGGSS